MDTPLCIGLPHTGSTPDAPLHTPLFDALLTAKSPYRPLLHSAPSTELTLALQNDKAYSALFCAGSDAASMAITPSLCLEPAPNDALIDFLRARRARVNHLGINLAAASINNAAWRAFIDTVAGTLPSYQLELGSANDVVMVLSEDIAVELVYDRSGAPSSLHVCLEVDASRTEVEHSFPAPTGGYKPGDEAFFYSVGLPLGAALACYADFAFAEAPVIDWRAIVAAAGRRLP